mgnify:CR=1
MAQNLTRENEPLEKKLDKLNKFLIVRSDIFYSGKSPIKMFVVVTLSQIFRDQIRRHFLD